MGLTVAVTGPTGEIGISAVTALEREPAISKIIGMARRPFDPLTRGWTKTTYMQGDILLLGALTYSDIAGYYAMMARGVSMTHRDFLLANEQRQRMRRAWLGFLRIGTCSFAPSLPVQRRPMTRRASAGNAP